MANKMSPWLFLLLLVPLVNVIFIIWWLVKAMNSLSDLGNDIPSPWLLLLMLIPIVNIIFAIYLYYKLSVGVEKISGGSLNRWLMFILWIVIALVPMILTQLEINKKA